MSMETMVKACEALCAVCVTLLVHDYLRKKSRYDAEERQLRREELARQRELDDEIFRMQLAREQAFRDAEKIEEVA